MVVGTTTDDAPGQKTAQQVAAFQGIHGLAVDGVAGPITCKKIAAIKAFSTSSQQTTRSPSTGGSIKLLSNREVARRESGRKAKKVVDLKTKRTFKVSWDASPGCHTDFTPMTAADTTVKGFLLSRSATDKAYWGQTSSRK